MPSLQQLRALMRASSTPMHSRPTAAASVAAFRRFNQATILRQPYKNDQHRESLKPRAQEYSKSGSDEEAAAKDKAAYNPNKTRPEGEKDEAGNPLEVSPANKDVSQPKGGAKEMMGGGDTTDKKKPSGGGSPQKKSRPW